MPANVFGGDPADTKLFSQVCDTLVGHFQLRKVIFDSHQLSKERIKVFSQALRDNTHLYVRKSQSQTNISEQLHPEPQDPGQAQDAGTHTYTHTPGSMTARRPTHITDTHVTHIHTGLSERSRGARTPANARTQPYPDHPSFPDTTYQGCRASSRCSIGALQLDQNHTQIHRRAVGMHTRADYAS